MNSICNLFLRARRYALLALLLLVLGNGYDAGAALSGQTKKAAKAAFACLPKDVKADEILTYGVNGKPNLTVQDTLKQMKARCRKGKLVARDNREIHFFRRACWGNPPMEADEIRAEEYRQLQELKKKYRVVSFSCDPKRF